MDVVDAALIEVDLSRDVPVRLVTYIEKPIPHDLKRRIQAGGSFRTGTRPTLILIVLLRAGAITMDASHAPISV